MRLVEHDARWGRRRSLSIWFAVRREACRPRAGRRVDADLARAEADTYTFGPSAEKAMFCGNARLLSFVTFGAGSAVVVDVLVEVARRTVSATGSITVMRLSTMWPRTVAAERPGPRSARRCARRCWRRRPSRSRVDRHVEQGRADAREASAAGLVTGGFAVASIANTSLSGSGISRCVASCGRALSSQCCAPSVLHDEARVGGARGRRSWWPERRRPPALAPPFGDHALGEHRRLVARVERRRRRRAAVRR